MSDNPLISVIIPVYRVENYLEECVGSVLSQTYENLEIILVDDGSPDKCPQMCDDIATRDSRVKVIHKQNGGLSDARNAGIDIAGGEYITFVDSDDWVEQDIVEFLYNDLIAYDADISCCGAYRAYPEGNILPARNTPPWKPILLSNTDAAVMVHTKPHDASAYAKLYKRHIFNQIRYPAGRIYEDAWMIVDIYMTAKNIIDNPEPKYYYRKRKNSLVHKLSAYEVRKLKMEMYEARLNTIEAKYPQLQQLGEAKAAAQYISVLETILIQHGIKKGTDEYRTLISIKKTVSGTIARLMKNPHISRAEKIKLLIYSIGIYPYRFLQALSPAGKIRRLKKTQSKPGPEYTLFD